MTQPGNTVAEVTAQANNPMGPGKMVLSYRHHFAKVLPTHVGVDAFVRLSQGLLARNADLAAAARANPQSLMSALMEAARLGHEPGTDHYALTVRKIGGNPSILGIEQYQGVIERMYRAGGVKAVHAHVVRQNDVFRWNPTDGNPPYHQADWFGPDAARGDLLGVYAFAVLDSGVISRVVVMGRDEVMRHRAAATTKNVWDGPWQPSMWLKTAAHELEKWVPTSAEYRTQVARSAAAVADAGVRPQPRPMVYGPDDPPTVDPQPGPTLTGVIVEDPPDPGWPETAVPGSGQAMP